MPTTKTILVNEDMVSIAATEFNTVEALFALAMANNKGISDDVNNGDIIIIPDYSVATVYLQNKKRDNAILSYSVIAELLQTLIDIDIQTSKSLNNVFTLALMNGIGITDDLISGQNLITLGNILDSFFVLRPASGIPALQKKPGGIGYMQIGTSFKVS